MKTKTMLLALGAMSLSSAAVAQVSYGIKAGVNLTKTNYDMYPSQFEQSNYASYYLTAYGEVGLGKNFAFQPGVSLQGKGDKYTLDGDKAATWDIMSIEVPVNFLYYIPTGASGSLFLGAGPYVGINISGKSNVTDKGAPYFGTVGEHKMSFTGDKKNQKLMDAGANFLLGYKLSKGFVINTEYGLGLADVNPEGSDKHLHNYTIRFGVGYQF